MSLKLFVLVAACVAVVASQSYQQPAYQAPAYQAPAYPAPAYQAPAYESAKGRVKIQVYRGPNKDYNNYDSFAPNGYYVQQPEDNKAPYYN